jgi:hypothetical protein
MLERAAHPVLGRHLVRHGLSAVFKRKVFRLGPLSVVLAPLLGLCGLGLLPFSRPALHEAIKMEVVAFVLLGAAFGLFITWLRERRRTIDVHEKGLLDDRGDGNPRAYSWDDLATIWVKNTVWRTSDNHAPRTSRYRIVTTRDETLVLTERVEGIARLGALVEREMASRLQPKLLQQIASGFSVAFGRFVLTREGIERGDERLSWTDFAGCAVKDGTIKLKRRGKRWPWARTRYAAVPNAKMFLAALAKRGAR